MHVCLDARVLFGSQPHGIARAVGNLLRELVRDGRGLRYTVLVRGPWLGTEAVSAPHMRFVSAPWPPYDIRGLARVPVLLQELRPDVYHCPTYMAPAWTPCPLVVTVYDLIHLKFPGDYGWRHRLYYQTLGRLAYRRAWRVLTCSTQTADDLVRHLHVPRSRLVVQPLALDPAFGPTADPVAHLRERLGLEPPFILSVVNPRPHKNVAGLWRAYALLRTKLAVPPLVLVGVDRPPAAPAEAAESPGTVYCFPEVGDRVLADLYACATAFVLPSLAEGFGLPLLEAMHCGAPIACSRTPAMIEVVGPAAILFDPHDPDDMACALARLVTDAGLADRLRQRGRQRAAAFSLRDLADQTVATYRAAGRRRSLAR